MKMQRNISKPLKISFIGTYLPRKCGIATFTYDVSKNVQDQISRSNYKAVEIVAINNVSQKYRYDPEVKFEIEEQKLSDYISAANFLNYSNSDLVCLQHEFGIFGGTYGNYILELLKNLNKPVVTNLHTVQESLNEEQAGILREICERSEFIIVMSRKSADLLVNLFGVPSDKIVFIYHGTPDVPFVDPNFLKPQFNLERRRVILTFGLIGPGKGIEVGIEAVSLIAKDFKDVAYVVLGATHPNIRMRSGEQYRDTLINLTRSKGIEDNVIFYNKFVDIDQLVEFLLMSDIYMTPNLSREQSVSGTLSYAIACGKAIISTPYDYAREMLAEGRGSLVPFEDHYALARQLSLLLSDQKERDRLRKNAYEFGRQMIWKEVARAYLRIFEQAVESYYSLPRFAYLNKEKYPVLYLPEVNTRSLGALKS
ncbi:MAG: glycosyltransferase family 4 protein [Actinobacteria bacterium]|nr:glycosyltransferase family 4 protein [Actinomycetota bacterium]